MYAKLSGVVLDDSEGVLDFALVSEKDFVEAGAVDVEDDRA